MADTIQSLRAELDLANKNRESVVAERAAALAERDKAVTELDDERGRNDKMKSDRDRAMAERDELKDAAERARKDLEDVEGTAEMRCALAQEHPSRDQHVLKTYGVGGAYRLAYRKMLELRNELNEFAVELGMPKGEQLPDLLALVKELRAARAEKRNPVRPG